MSETSYIETSEGEHSRDKTGRVEDRDKSCMQSCAHCGLSGHDISEGLGCNPTGQTGETETAIRPGWLAQLESGPWVKGREMEQKNSSSS